MGGFKLKIDKPNDEKSIAKAIEILNNAGCKDVGDLNTIDKYSIFDISGKTKDGAPFVAECKDKTVPHNKYNDVMIDKAKLDKFNSQPYYESLLAFNFYSDNYVGIANPDHGYKTIERITPATTEFGDRGTEKQTLISMPQQKLIKI